MIFLLLKLNNHRKQCVLTAQFMFQVLNLLTEKEVKQVLPTQAIIPRTFILKPGMVLFLAALGRVDYLQVGKNRIAAASSSGIGPNNKR